MIKSFLIDSIKTLFFNAIGICILYKSSCYIYEHNDVSFLIYTALLILFAIGIYFIRKDFTEPTVEETSRMTINLFLYAYLRKRGITEKDDISEIVLNKTTCGEIVKEFMCMIDENDSKVKEFMDMIDENDSKVKEDK